MQSGLAEGASEGNQSMEPRAKLWVEHEGRLALSDYRLRLLEIVERTHSLADAASELGLSYRRAWGKIKEMEANTGHRLVVSRVGGAGGGHTELTPQGRDLVERYRRFQSLARRGVEDAFRSAFGE